MNCGVFGPKTELAGTEKGIIIKETIDGIIYVTLKGLA